MADNKPVTLKQKLYMVGITVFFMLITANMVYGTQFSGWRDDIPECPENQQAYPDISVPFIVIAPFFWEYVGWSCSSNARF